MPYTARDLPARGAVYFTMDTGTSPASMEAPSRSVLSVARTVAIFAIAFAVVDLALGIVPVNLLLRHFMRDAMPHVWLVSVARLAVRCVISAVACASVLRASGRTGGLLTTTAQRGAMSIGAVTSGALAGALDVGAHRLLVRQLIQLAQHSSIASELGSALLTLASAAVIAAILLVPRTRIVRTANTHEVTEQPA